jgi:hypothetical protein
MATIVPQLEVPSWIATGLANGLYSRFGGMIRVAAGNPNAGQIIALLRDSGIPSEAITSLLPAFAGMMPPVTLGVCALGFVSLSRQLTRIETAISETKLAIDGLAVDFDRSVLANLEAAVQLLEKAERAQVPANNNYLHHAIDRFLESSSIFRSRFDATSDEDRDVLEKYFQSYCTSLAGELACHYLQEDWNEVHAVAAKAKAEVSSRKRRLISLALNGTREFTSWESTPILPAIFATSAAQIPFSIIFELAQSLDPSISAMKLIDTSRPFLKTDAGDIGSLSKLRMAEVIELNKRKTYWNWGPQCGDLAIIVKAAVRCGMNALMVGNAVESYPEQYALLNRADLSASKLKKLLRRVPDDRDALLVIDRTTAP